MKKIELNSEYFTIDDISKKSFKEALHKAVCKDYEQVNVDKPKINQTIVAYDSETTNYKLSEKDYRPFVFSLNVTVLNPITKFNLNFNARTISDFKKFMLKLKREAGCQVNAKPMINKKTGEIVTDSFGNTMYDEHECKYVNVFVHNLPFDISFLMKELNIFTLFASDPHKPYYVVTQNGFRWVDTVKLTQNNLYGLGKQLKQYSVRKAVGDFDYNKVRCNKTKFTNKEKTYVVNDTLVLAAYLDEIEMPEAGYSMCQIPLTMTGRIRRDLYKLASGVDDELQTLYDQGILNDKQLINYPLLAMQLSNKSKFKKAYQNSNIKKREDDYIKRKMSKMTDQEKRDFIPIDARKDWQKNEIKREKKALLCDKPSDTMYYELYHDLVKAYAGGFTHANPSYLGKVVKNVRSFDFTSSYPTVLLSEKYPSGDAKKIDVDKVDQKELLNKIEHEDEYSYMYVFKISADACMSKVEQDYYFSKNKLDIDKETYVQEFNGRVRAVAGHFSVWVTGADWEIIKQVYDFDNLKIEKCWRWLTQYLPLYVIGSVLKYYAMKTKLKGLKGRERDYLRGKQKLNSIYGMMVQLLLKPDVEYINGKWIKIEPNRNQAEDILKHYTSSPKRVTQFVWGVMCASYARRNLWTGILAVGDDYVYSDTDSIKIKNYKEHLDYVNAYNKHVVDKITKCLKHYNFDLDLQSPVDLKGKAHQLGVWDANDGYYKAFKTLGAKRYVDVEHDTNEFSITIAGLSKSQGAKYILDASATNYTTKKIGDGEFYFVKSGYMKAFNFFNNQMFVPKQFTGKLAHVYVDSYKAFKVTDYQDNTAMVQAGSGCYLGAVDFTMSLSDKTLNFIDEYNKGIVKVPDQVDHVGF